MTGSAGREVSIRPNLGLYTQPISFIGLPVLAVPVCTPGHMPAGVQLIAAPWREAVLFRVAHWLERQGVVGALAAGGGRPCGSMTPRCWPR